MCLEEDLFKLIFFGHLWALCIWISKSQSSFGKFSAIIDFMKFYPFIPLFFFWNSNNSLISSLGGIQKIT